MILLCGSVFLIFSKDTNDLLNTLSTLPLAPHVCINTDTDIYIYIIYVQKQIRTVICCCQLIEIIMFYLIAFNFYILYQLSRTFGLP